MQKQASLTKAQQLFDGFFQANPKTALRESIRYLHLTLVRCQIQEQNEFGYLAALDPLTREEAVLGFSRALEECRFFPPPATLREYSGRVADGDPIARESKEQLLVLLYAMRGPHGPSLRPIPGRVRFGSEECPRDEAGRVTSEPIREPETPFLCERRTLAALVRLGWGDKERGIAVIAEHPALNRQPEAVDGQYRQNQLRAADEILKRFTEAYREV